MTGPADLVVEGRIATLAGEAGFGWAEAIAIAGGRVTAAGSAADVAGAAPRTRRLRLAAGEVAIPGLSDAHLHLAEAGLALDGPDLTAARTIDEGLAILGAAHARLAPGRWLEGHGWDAGRWGGWPTADALESAAPGRPAAIWAHDHHALWVNRSALALAGIGAETVGPPGGLVLRDADGRPTGVLQENATVLVTARIPPASAVEIEAGVAALARELIGLGVVGVHDPGRLALVSGLGPAIEAYRVLAERGALGVRVHASIRPEQLDAAIEAGLRTGDALLGAPDSNARFGWLKLFADGSLGSRTAATLEPWEPDQARPLPPGTEHGVWTTSPDDLRRLVARAAADGIATEIHAIGDAAARAALDVFASHPAPGPARQRIEHVQLVAADDVPRFGRLGVVASVQPAHLRSDAAAARRGWGARAEVDSYRLRSLLDAGAVLAFGTDAPVEPVDPWPGIELAVIRRSPAWDDDAPFGPHEALSLDVAFRAACIGPAIAAGEERDRGRLTVGQRADIVVIPAAALGEPVEPGGPLGRVRPRLVLVGGAVAHEA